MYKDMIRTGKKIIDKNISIKDIDENIRIVVYKDGTTYHINILYYTKKWLLLVDRTGAKYEKAENIIKEIIMQPVNDGFSIAY